MLVITNDFEQKELNNYIKDMNSQLVSNLYNYNKAYSEFEPVGELTWHIGNINCPTVYNEPFPYAKLNVKCLKTGNIYSVRFYDERCISFGKDPTIEDYKIDFVDVFNTPITTWGGYDSIWWEKFYNLDLTIPKDIYESFIQKHNAWVNRCNTWIRSKNISMVVYKGEPYAKIEIYKYLNEVRVRTNNCWNVVDLEDFDMFNKDFQPTEVDKIEKFVQNLLNILETKYEISNLSQLPHDTLLNFLEGKRK